MLQYNKVDYLAVAYIDEGVALRNTGISLPIMILNPEASAFDKLTEFNLEPVIYSFGLFDDYIKYAREKNVLNYPIHLKIDTGMHRLGFENADIETLCDMLEENRYVRVESIFSHLVASEDKKHDEFTKNQIKNFELEALEGITDEELAATFASLRKMKKTLIRMQDDEAAEEAE